MLLVGKTRNGLYPWLISILSGMRDMLHDGSSKFKVQSSKSLRIGKKLLACKTHDKKSSKLKAHSETLNFEL